MVKSLDRVALVADFADTVERQTEALMRGDFKVGNKHAKRRREVFALLREIGDSGRDELCGLFVHERPDVRVMAAAYMLRYRTDDALAVLREVAKGKGLVPFKAAEAIKRWEDGTWELDPV